MTIANVPYTAEAQTTGGPAGAFDIVAVWTGFAIRHMTTLARFSVGRILLHLLALLGDRCVRFHIGGITRELPWVAAATALLLTLIPSARADEVPGYSFEAAAQEVTQLLWLAETASACGWARALGAAALPTRGSRRNAGRRRTRVSALWPCDAQSRCHVHQVGERGGLHFSHHPASVCLHRDLADAKLGTDLLVQQTGDYQRHHLPFASAK